MNSDSVKTKKDVDDDGKKKESTVDKEWRLKRKLLKCWWREKKESAVDEEEVVDLMVAGKLLKNKEPETGRKGLG